MSASAQADCTAFDRSVCIASGPLSHVALTVKKRLSDDPEATVLIFDDSTSHLIDLDLRGSDADIVARLAPAPNLPVAGATLQNAEKEAPRGPGRPKLGVVAREITLLPRHWEWLNTQPGGASVALRKLVEDARRASSGKDQVRHAQEVCYRFMSVIAGHQPHFEEATRALFAGNRQRFEQEIEGWPADVLNHVKKLSVAALPVTADSSFQ